ncbi:hypothetical protein BML2537_17180 [Providencia stuartii]|nr:hypothetical protein BML2537_17180 [Providencia stuartii]GHB89580.1 hypothetical protein GCM10007290_14350 [Providencia thailandensis]
MFLSFDDDILALKSKLIFASEKARKIYSGCVISSENYLSGHVLCLIFPSLLMIHQLTLSYCL